VEIQYQAKGRVHHHNPIEGTDLRDDGEFPSSTVGEEITID